MTDVERVLAGLAKLQGASMEGVADEEIAELETALGLVFPPSYRTFLRHAGRHVGVFLEGSDFRFDQLRKLNAVGREILAETVSGTDPTRHYYVFLMHQGYQFLFCEAGPDERPVLKWVDDEGVTVVAESFGAWFSATVDEELGYED